tara:strand:+ start:1548 stop:1718 length:171 start_codon:yes stop_codon:yes gene_type:complete
MEDFIPSFLLAKKKYNKNDRGIRMTSADIRKLTYFKYVVEQTKKYAEKIHASSLIT